MSLSVIITTCNHEKIIKRALESVKFADEIVVVDLESTDKTVGIAKKYTDKIFTHKNVGFVEPVRNFSLKKATGDWILILDADEEVPPSLGKILRNVAHSKSPADFPDCFYLPRKNIVFKKWLKTAGWWPDYQLRFFKKGQVEWSDKIHSVPLTKGEVKEFPAEEKFALIHHNYQSVSQFLKRADRYSSIQATEMKEESTAPAEVLQEFTDSFLNRFFAQKGFKGGMHGASLSLLQASTDAVAKIKVWEKEEFPLKEDQIQEELEVLSQFKKEVAYWLAQAQLSEARGLKRWWWRLRRKLQL